MFSETFLVIPSQVKCYRWRSSWKKMKKVVFEKSENAYQDMSRLLAFVAFLDFQDFNTTKKIDDFKNVMGLHEFEAVDVGLHRESQAWSNGERWVGI